MKLPSVINFNEPYVRIKNDGILIHIHVNTKAKITMIEGKYADALKLKVSAPPQKGKANEEIIKYFAKLFDVTQHDVKIIKGELSRDKVIYIRTKIK